MLLHQKMRRQTTPASHDEVNRYRTWLKEDRPLSDLEMKFLDDEHDIVSLSRNRGISTTAQQGGPSSLSTFFLLTSTAIHLLLFKHVFAPAIARGDGVPERRGVGVGGGETEHRFEAGLGVLGRLAYL